MTTCTQCNRPVEIDLVNGKSAEATDHCLGVETCLQRPRSWAAEVVADRSGEWKGNQLRFATKEAAQVYVQDLAARWTLVSETRVVASADPVREVG